MTDEFPVFATKYEAELWKSIAHAEGQNKKEKREKAISNVLRKVETGKECVSSAILCKLIRIVTEVEADGWQSDIEDLIAKQKPDETRASLTAASCMAKKTFLKEAYAYLDSAKENANSAFYNLVKAEVLFTAGKSDDAQRHLNKSLRSDPLNESAYELLTRMKPGTNWKAICAIERIAAGLPYEEPPAEPNGFELGLFAIYREWYEGDRDTALRMLNNSEGYRSGDSDYLLLSARMAMTKGEFANARSIYTKVTENLPTDVCILCEAGNSYLAGPDPDPAAAMTFFRNAESIDPSNPRVIRGLVDANYVTGNISEAIESMKMFLATEAAQKKDFEHMAALLSENGDWPEVSEVASQILITYPDDTASFILKSKAAVNDGDISAAHIHARSAVSSNRKNPEALAQLSHVELLLRHTKTAVKLASKAMAIDDTSMPVLLAMLGACREDGDVDTTNDVCQRILEIDPKNETAQDILTRLQMDRIVKGATEEEITLKATDLKEFTILAKKLLEDGRFSEVEKLCRENADKFSDSAEFRRIKGNAEYGIGEYVRASASFASAAVMCPDSAEIWHSKGLADEGFNDLESALEAYNRAVLLDMKNPHYWISRGCVLQAKGDDVGAVESFNHAIEIDQTAPYPLIRKAAILANYGRYSDALVYMDMAESAAPDNRSIQVLKMKMCLMSGRYNDACSIGLNLIAKEDDTSVVADLARAEMELGNTNGARDRLEKELAEYPDDLHLLTAARDVYLRLEDKESLVDVCHRIGERNPYDRETMTIMANALMKDGRGDEASVILENINRSAAGAPSGAEEEKPEVTDSESLFNIAQSMLQVGDVSGSERNADKLLQLDPDNEDYVLFRSRIFERAGDVQAAESFLKDYLRHSPDSIRIIEALGDLLAKQEKHAEAVEAYSKCLESISPRDNPSYRARLLVKQATSQEAMKARPAAIRSYTEAVQLNPRDTESARILTQMLLMSGDKDTALNVIRAAINVEESAANYAILAQVCQMRKDVEGVRNAYRGFLRFDSRVPEDLMKVVNALNSVGLHNEADMLREHSDSARRNEANAQDDVSPAVKRCAERMMRRAYMQGASIDSPSIRDSADVDSDLANKALEYLNDIPDYGDVIPGLPDYERMEILTYNILAAPRSRGIENPSVDTAYVAGHAKDADEAKMLVAYIHSAKVSRLPDDPPQSLREIAEGYSKVETIPQIMKDCRCGIMTARIIQSLIPQ